ncbi:hypothetical protein Ancab_012838 [Ancistrocladus abbreviatus]
MAADSVVQDQRKHALEALERRFAVAKAEVQQQLSNKKRRHEEGKLVNLNSPASSAEPPFTASASSLSNISSKKDMEADAPTYLQISQHVHENLITSATMPVKGKSIVDKILHELLQSGDSAQKYMLGSRSMKIDNWILLDNFVQGHGTSASRLRALKSHSKRSKRRMSMKQLKKCGVFEIPENFHKFDVFEPLHAMWKSYVIQLLRNTGKNQLAQCLLGADLHGAILRVVECKIDAFVGVMGIMIRETAETFGIVTQDNSFKVVPKRISIFILQADCWKITLHGQKLASRKLG